jgi:uncharacterized membrane protein YhaH (DUF805 family)/cold shock CspA family protein
MRGEVLHYDEAQGFGFIAGSDGNRYTFRREDLRRSFQPSRGVTVEFRASRDQARDVAAAATTLAARQDPILAGEGPQAASALASMPTATPSRPRIPQRYGRNADGSGSITKQATHSLWNYFWNAVTTDHVNFHGRARRKEYWGYCLFWILLFGAGLAITVALDEAAGNFGRRGEWPLFGLGFSAVFVIATFLPGLAITVRRIHDIGLTGWFYLLVLVPSVGWLIILVFALIPSQKRENRWGPAAAGADDVNS